ncbi:hypothetical protein [Thermoleptolyngbya sp.]
MSPCLVFPDLFQAAALLGAIAPQSSPFCVIDRHTADAYPVYRVIHRVFPLCLQKAGSLEVH